MGLARIDVYERYTIGCNFMFTYLGIPHPSALIIKFKWASLGSESTQSGNKPVFGEFDVCGLFREVVSGSSQGMLFSL